jgi:hypothetical protein
MLRRSSLFILAVTCLSLTVAVAGPQPARIPAAIMLLTILPGAALTQLVFGRGLHDRAEWVATTIGLGLAAVVLGGLVLNETTGITRGSVACFAAGLTITAVIASAIIDRGTDSPRPQPRSRSRSRVRVSIFEGLIFVASATLVVLALAYGRTPLPARGAQGYTVLWIDAKHGSLELGVESQELKRREYRLDVRGVRQAAHDWRITLSPGKAWSTTVGPPPVGKGKAVNATLYVRRPQGWVAYRRVRDVQ